MHTRPLAELRAADGALFGGKSASLGELIEAGIPVPPGFALASTAFDAGAVERGPRARCAPATPCLDAVRAEIVAELRGAGRAAPPVAVRSSALGEDSAEATFAGQQDTYLWVRGADAVLRRGARLLGQPLQPGGGQLPRAHRRRRRARRWG